MTTIQTAITIALFALATIITRSLAFVIFPAGRSTPKFVVYLGRVLPFAITAMLIVYCLRNTTIATPPHGMPELLAILLTVILYLLFKKTPLIAIAAGTVAYMVLVQYVFAV